MTEQKNDGGPAFPTTIYYDDRPVGISDGLSLRDYFAAQALAVIPGDLADPADLARDAYRIADALIAERAK